MLKTLIKRPLAISAAIQIAVMAMTAAPKYIFYFIGDGMGINEVANSQIYNRHVLKNEKPLLMTTFPVVSMAASCSANSDVTDSAAAGTALAAGVKTNNGMLGVTPDTVAVTSIAKRLYDNGFGIGIITSVAVDDATPGAFYTHVADRSQYYDTGRMLAESGYQFAAGAALRGTKDKNGLENDLMSHFKKNNVSVCYGLENLDKNAEKVLVLSPFHEQNDNCIGYTVDSIPGALTLPALTNAGLDHLLRVSPDRFFIMVEGGNIDHAGHANDGGTSVREIVNFNDALKIAYDFYTKHPDETLIVVTADHETGGMSVGCGQTGYSVRPQNIAAQKISKEAFNSLCNKFYNEKHSDSWGEMKTILREKLGLWTNVGITAEEEENLHENFIEVFEKNRGENENTLYASYNEFVTNVFRLINGKSGYGWTTGGHTGSPVPVYAIGEDCMLFTNPRDNTEIPKLIMKAAGIAFE